MTYGVNENTSEMEKLDQATNWLVSTQHYVLSLKRTLIMPSQSACKGNYYKDIFK